MAASESVISQFQDVIRCSICGEEVGQLHCDTCQVYICKSCAGTHLTTDMSKQHVVVECKKRSKIKLTECKTHTSRRCELYCEPCNVSVCSKCMASTHAQHKVIDILEFCDNIQNDIKAENKELEESKISCFEKSLMEMKAQIEDLPNKYGKITKEITECGEVWHKKIDATIKEFKDEVEKMMKIDLEKLTDNYEQLEKLISRCRLIQEENTEILQSSEMSMFLEYKPKIQDIRDIPLIIDVKLPKFQPAEMVNEGNNSLFGSLCPGSLELSNPVDEQQEPSLKEQTLPDNHICMWTISKDNFPTGCQGCNKEKNTSTTKITTEPDVTTQSFFTSNLPRRTASTTYRRRLAVAENDTNVLLTLELLHDIEAKALSISCFCIILVIAYITI